MAKATLGVLSGIKEWNGGSSTIIHTHTDEYGKIRICHDLTCDLWWWHDPVVKSSIPERFIEWVGHDISRATAAIHVGTHEKLNLLTGITIKIPLLGKRVRLSRLLKRLGQLGALIGTGIVFRYFEIIVGIF